MMKKLYLCCVIFTGMLLTNAVRGQADFCANAVEIIPTLTNCNPVAGSSANATQTYPTCSGGGNADDDVWYFFTANSTTMTIDVDPTVGYDAVIELYLACGSLNNLACEDINGNNGDETLTYAPLTIGATYYFRVYHYGAGSGTSTFNVCVTGLAPTTNNTPCNAFALPAVTPACQFQTYTNAGSAGSAVPAPTGCGGSAPQQGGYAGGDVWFSVTVPASGTLDIHTLSQTFGDGAMALYSGTCGALTLVECDDDDGPGLMPYIYATGLTPGATMYIRVWEYGNNNNGQFGICVSTPDNDLCANALEICDLNGYGGITSSAYLVDRPDNMAGTGEIPPGPFGTGYTGPSPVTIDNNHWLKFTATSNTAELFVDIHACALNLGMQMQIFEATNCTNFVAVSNFLETTNSQTVLATGLSIGQTYYIMVDGFAGDVCSYTITATSGVQVVDVTAVPAQLCLGDTATITANITGTGSYTYTWSSNPAGGPYPSTVSFQVAPTTSTEYVVDITGLCGSGISADVTVVVNDNPSASISPVAPEFCEGQSVSMTSSYAGGSGIYTGGVWSSNLNVSNDDIDGADLSGNTAGNYFVTYTVTDNNGCEATDSVDVVVNPLPDASIAPVSDLCHDADPVTMVPTVPGGTFSGNGVSGNTFNPALVSPGTHTITYAITDGNNCSNSSTIDIVVNPLPNATVTPMGPFCVDGLATAVAVPVNGGTLSGSGVSGGAFDPGTAGVGTHWVVYEVTDNNGCFNSDSIQVTVNPLPDASFNPISDVCNDAAVINLTPTTPGGTFSGNGVSGNTFDPTTVAPGTHTITYSITDGNNCSNSTSVDVDVFPVPDATITPIGPFCNDATPVTVSIPANGGTLSGPGISGTTFDPQTAGVGSHWVVYDITNASGCNNNDSIQVTVNGLPDATITPVADLCNDANAVTIMTATAGGSLTGQGLTGNSFDPSGLAPGTYQILYNITDGNNCNSSDSIDIIVNPLPDATIAPIGPFCTGDAAVPLSAATSGGTFSGTGVSGNNFDPSGLTAGTYSINYSITDNNGCSASDQFDAIIADAYDATIAPAGPFCSDDAAVNLQAADLGGSWTGPGITDATNGTFDPAAGPGSYEVMYSIPGGCGDQDTAIIIVNPSFDASITGVGPFCSDDPAVQLTAADQGGVWSGNGIIDSLTGTFSPADAGSGVHTITYVIDGVCGDTQTTTIMVNQTPPPPSVTSDTTCDGTNPVLYCNSSWGSLYWYDDPSLTNPIATNVTSYTATASGTYYVIEEFAGCVSGVGSGVALIYNIDASFVATPDSGAAPLTVDFTNTSTGVTASDQFFWDFGDGNSSTDFEPSHTYTTGGTFTVTLTVTTADGACSDQYTWEIIVDDSYYVEIPNVFSPNGDGINDVFNIEYQGVKEVTIVVYNRWGQLLAEWFSLEGGWDGRTTAGETVPDGTYYYIITIINNLDEQEEFTGPFTLIR